MQADIKANDALIAQKNIEIGFMKNQMFAALRQYGFAVPREEFDAMFTTVTGNQDLEILASYMNSWAIVDLIKKYVTEDGATVDQAKEYYGIYALTVASLIDMHMDQLSTVQGFMAKMQELMRENEANLNETNASLAKPGQPEDLRAADLRNLEKITRTGNSQKQYYDFLSIKANTVISMICQIQLNITARFAPFALFKMPMTLTMPSMTAKVPGPMIFSNAWAIRQSHRSRKCSTAWRQSV